MWSTITTDTVTSRLNPAESAAFQTMQGGLDTLAQVLGDVVDTVRGNILAAGNQLGPDGTVPDQLKIHVVSMTIWLWLTAFSKNDKLQTDGRKQNYTDAVAELKEIAAGRQRVELPMAGEAQVIGSPVNAIEVANTNPRKATRDLLSGL